MVRPKCCFPDCQGASFQRFCYICGAAPVGSVRPQAQRIRDTQIAGAEGDLEERDRTSVQWLSIGVAGLIVEHNGQVTERRGDIRVLAAERSFANRQCTTKCPLGLSIPSL